MLNTKSMNCMPAVRKNRGVQVFGLTLFLIFGGALLSNGILAQPKAPSIEDIILEKIWPIEGVVQLQTTFIPVLFIDKPFVEKEVSNYDGERSKTDEVDEEAGSLV